MAQQTINVGAAANDGTGDPLRTSFQKTNANFTELYTATGPSGNNIVVPGSATITGDLTVDTNVLFVDSANNRVGVNRASPLTNLHIGSGGGGNDLGVLLSRGATVNFFEAYDGTKTAFIGTDSAQAFVKIGAFSNHPVGFVVNNGLVATLDTSGNLGLGVTPTAGAGVLQLSSGINFPATEVASANANTLDDYEEGTWTPTPNSGTFSFAVGSYTKIGNMVTLYYDIIIGTGGGDRFTNLPFQSGVTVGAGVFTTAQEYVAGTTSPTFVVGGSSTIGFFRTVGDNVAFSAMTFTASAGISGSISYRI